MRWTSRCRFSPADVSQYKNLADLDVSRMGHQRLLYRQFSEEEQRNIFHGVTCPTARSTT